MRIRGGHRRARSVPDYSAAVVTDRAARTAAAILACAGAGGQLAGAAADGWFLAAIGPGHLGAAVAVSSVLVAVVVAAIGGLADRRDRQRWLVAVAATGAVALTLVSLGHDHAPRATAIIGFIAVKQLQAAVELAFWVAVSDWFDARTLRRQVPRLAAAGGVGGVIGAGLVAPIAHAAGASALLLCGAGGFALAALSAGLMPRAHRVGVGRLAPSRGGWLDGVDALRRQPLARGLAALVAVAGVAASLTYVALGAAAAAHERDASALAGLLGSVRMIGQLAMIGAQLVLAPRILARLGVGGALVVAPALAVGAALGVISTGALAAVALQAALARVADGAIESPAEKLAQNLLPLELRGRLGGWLEGPAKRTGAVVGGALAAVVAASTIGWLLAVTAIVWLAIALRVRAHLPQWVLGTLATRGVRADDEVALGERAARQLVLALAATEPARAAEVAARLHAPPGFDARPLVVELYRDAAATDDRAAIAAALERTVGAGERDAVLAAALAAIVDDEPQRWSLVGRLGRGARLTVALDDGAAAAIARARLAGDADAVAAALDDAVGAEDAAVAALGVRELACEVADRAATGVDGHALGRQLLRVVRRRDGLAPTTAARAIDALAALAAVPGDSAEAQWLRADTAALVRSLLPTAAPAPVRAAAVAALGRWTVPSGGPVARPSPVGSRPDGSPTQDARLSDPDDLAALTDALGDRDDAVRAAAEAALRGLGTAAMVALVRTAGLGRRGARDRAVALLGELAVRPRELDPLVAAELDALDRLAVHAGALASLGDRALDRRLDERLAEVGHTALSLVAAQDRSGAIARAARAARTAATVAERARAVEILDATLPRAIAARVVPLLEPGPLPARVTGAEARCGAVDADVAIAAELTGSDRLTRDLLIRALPGPRRAQFRGALHAAAHAAAAAIAPLDLLRRVTDLADDDDVPPTVDVLLVLAEVPALAGLTTPQLAAIAERGEVFAVDDGDVIVTDGERLDALVVVLDGAVTVGDRKLGRGAALDELAAVAPRPSPRVAAVGPTRLFRLRRLELDELIDDEPGLGSALVRYLATALRNAR